MKPAEMSTNTSSFSTLLGPSLIGKSGSKVNTDDALAGKYVGLYFSAHWCPPCRAFTPMLSTFYQEHKNSLNLEIVFVSGDRDEKSWKQYYDSMPWLSIPYGTVERSLNSKFSVMGIPSLVILNPNGEVMTNNGRSMVMSDPSGREFPWRGTSSSNAGSAMNLFYIAFVLYLVYRYLF